MEDSTLWGMGEGHFGRLGDGTTSVKYSPVQTVSGGVTQASAGNEHTMFVKEDGSLWGTGLNWFGQLGDGTGENHSAPVHLIRKGYTGCCWPWSHNVREGRRVAHANWQT